MQTRRIRRVAPVGVEFIHQGDDASRQRRTRRAVHDLFGIESGGSRAFQRVIGTEQQVTNDGRLGQAQRFEALLQAADRLIDMHAYRQAFAAITLDQPVIGFIEPARLLLDQQHRTGGRQHNEIDLAQTDQIVVLTAPVHAMENRERRR